MDTHNGAGLADISSDDTLNPQMVEAVIDGKAEQFMNADTIISIAKDGETPVNRELWRTYQAALSRHKSAPGGRSSEKLRADALLEAMRQMNLPLAQSRYVEFW